MCGIFAVIGSREASPLIIDGLRKLEYRGYDSAGLATIQKSKKDIFGELIAFLRFFLCAKFLKGCNLHKYLMVSFLNLPAVLF